MNNSQLGKAHHPCVSCHRPTYQDIIFSNTHSENEYLVETIHEVIKCCGCGTISFREITRYIEQAEELEDNEWYVPETIKSYPKFLAGHHGSAGTLFYIPDIVKRIYEQSVTAIKEGSNILAGIGLRATLEAICNERAIPGRDLVRRIDGLAKKGLISITDANRLHAIRFLGNDAAHLIKQSEMRYLTVALKIIDHLLLTLYVLDNEAASLDSIIKDYREFEKLLTGKLKEFASGDELPLAKIFGHDIRRLHNYVAAHEKQLIHHIKISDYEKLTIGKKDNFAGSKEKVQHFIVV